MNGLLRRTGGVASAAVLVLAGGAPVAALAAAPAGVLAAGAVTMSIDDVRPNTPPITAKPTRLAFSITLVNHTAHSIGAITITASRSDPIGSQEGLNAALAKPKPPTPSQEAPLSTNVTSTLGPNQTATATLATTIGTDPSLAPDVCECANAIYPFYFVASATIGGTSVQLATAHTYLPSFTSPPTAKAQVGWMWPLLDRPHRLKRDNIFSDDELASEVQPGGRLDKLLSVLEQVAGRVPMTVLTDPDLIDELAVMSSPSGYRVVTPSGLIRGTGGADAAGWLTRLTALLEKYPKIEMAFTPFADPAVESLTRSGLIWSTKLPAAMQRRVTDALDGLLPASDIAWPAGQTLTARTLATLARQGVKTVVLTDRALTGPASSTIGTAADGSTHVVVPDALAPLPSGAGATITAAVTSTPIEHLVTRVLDPSGPGLELLPQLVAQLSIRVLSSVDASHYVLITPPRGLDVAVRVAVRTILATSSTTWAQPLPLRLATQTITPVDHGRLRAGLSSPQLPARTLATVHAVNNALPTVANMFAQPAVGVVQTSAYPVAVQRCLSNSFLGHPEQSIQYATILDGQVNRTQDGVRLVRPKKGYTLASRNAYLPVTVVNSLPDAVQIKVDLTSDSGVSGLSGGDVKPRTIPANRRVQLNVPTRVNRVGLLTVKVSLMTRDGLLLPSSIHLQVRSTTLGTIGVIITVVAAVVLAAALLIRFIRRFQHRRKPPNPPAAADPVPASTAAP